MVTELNQKDLQDLWYASNEAQADAAIELLLGEFIEQIIGQSNELSQPDSEMDLQESNEVDYIGQLGIEYLNGISFTEIKQQVIELIGGEHIEIIDQIINEQAERIKVDNRPVTKFVGTWDSKGINIFKKPINKYIYSLVSYIDEERERLVEEEIFLSNEEYEELINDLITIYYVSIVAHEVMHEFQSLYVTRLQKVLNDLYSDRIYSTRVGTDLDRSLLWSETLPVFVPYFQLGPKDTLGKELQATSFQSLLILRLLSKIENEKGKEILTDLFMGMSEDGVAGFPGQGIDGIGYNIFELFQKAADINFTENINKLFSSQSYTDLKEVLERKAPNLLFSDLIYDLLLPGALLRYNVPLNDSAIEFFKAIKNGDLVYKFGEEADSEEDDLSLKEMFIQWIQYLYYILTTDPKDYDY